MDGGEIRQNKITKEWVIFAPARGRRPRDFAREAAPAAPRPPHLPNCPFCPGNEAMLPAILSERPEGGAWKTRVAPNRYPVLTPEGGIDRRREGIYIAMEGYGQHEVIIDTPRHDLDVATMDPDNVRALIETYHERYLKLYQDDRNQLILIFRNHGPKAGASLEHPHSQIVTAGVMPRWIRWRNLEAQRHHDEWGCCVYCDIIAYERAEGVRVLSETEHFLCFIPYAAEVPFETWIIPRRHHPSFGAVTFDEKLDLAYMLQQTLGMIRRRLNNPDFNYVIYSSTRYGNAPQLHWYLRIRPRLVTRAGFEIGTGMRINPSLPEADAAFLRAEG